MITTTTSLKRKVLYTSIPKAPEQILYGEMDVVEIGGEKRCICLIKVDHGREAENSIAFRPEIRENRAYFGSVDNARYNITQE